MICIRGKKKASIKTIRGSLPYCSMDIDGWCVLQFNLRSWGQSKIHCRTRCISRGQFHYDLKRTKRWENNCLLLLDKSKRKILTCSSSEILSMNWIKAEHCSIFISVIRDKIQTRVNKFSFYQSCNIYSRNVIKLQWSAI